MESLGAIFLSFFLGISSPQVSPIIEETSAQKVIQCDQYKGTEAEDENVIRSEIIDNLYSLDRERWEKYKEIFGIHDICIPFSWGDVYLIGDDERAGARRISLGFEHLLEPNHNRWSKGYIIFSNYDYVAPMEYDTYATKRDYQMLRKNIPFNSSEKLFGKIVKKEEKKIFLQETPAIDRTLLKEVNYFGESVFSIHRQIIVPFLDFYIAFDFEIMGDLIAKNEEEKKEFEELFDAVIARNETAEITQFWEEIDLLVKSLKITPKENS